jgi:hypothetical protein
VFCAFTLMLEVAAKMPARGVLADEEGPLDAEDLADATGFPAEIFAKAFEVLTDDALKICWLEKRELSGVVGTSPATDRQDRTDRTGQELPTEAVSAEADELPAERGGSMVSGDAEKCLSPLKSGTPTQPADVAAKQPRALQSVQRRSPKGDESQAPQGFNEFWKKWPSHHRKVGKSKCLRIWRKLGLERVVADVLRALERSKASPDWRKDGGAFIPQPVSWLGNTPWETDAAEMVAAGRDPEKARATAEDNSRQKVEAERGGEAAARG